MAGDNMAGKAVIKQVLVIDDDEVTRNLVSNYLGRMGFTNCDLLEDGEAAWEAIQKKTYDLIVLDWKLPKLGGLALFNRIRQRPEYQTTPLLVISGLIDKEDFRLLQEFPCTKLVEKPFTMVLFENRVEEIRKESAWYGQNVALVDSILGAVKGDGKQAEQLLKQVLKKAPNPLPLALLAARQLVKNRLLKSAQGILEGVLKIDDSSVMAMNELGKTLHLMGRHKQALEVLRRANKNSRQNIQRLCLLGEVELNLADPDSAKVYFNKALAIDADEEKAKSGNVVADNMYEFLDTANPTRIPRNFASLLNTMGISLVRNKQFDKGIAQYRAALTFLVAGEDSARVTFNLGLGYLRWGKPHEALPWFQKSEALVPDGFGRSAGYVKQLVMAGVGELEEKSVADTEFAEESVASKPAEPTTEPTGESAPATEADEENGGKVIPFPGPANGEGGEEDKKNEGDKDEEGSVGEANQVVL